MDEKAGGIKRREHAHKYVKQWQVGWQKIEQLPGQQPPFSTGDKNNEVLKNKGGNDKVGNLGRK